MKVLLAEDDRVSSKLLEKNLRSWGYDVALADNGEDAWLELKGGAIRLAVLDWMMPGMNGVELCRLLRQDDGPQYTYLILLTSKDRGPDILEGLAAGADDYMTKPVNLLELKARLQTGRRIIELEEKLLESNRRLKEMASRDSLTSLWNRAHIVAFLDQELERGRREGRPTSVLMVDVDSFKQINDLHGHLVGDVVLIELAGRLDRGVRKYDRVGRYGGDEILIVLPDCGRQEAEDVAQRLRGLISRRQVATPAGHMPVSITVGFAVSDELTGPATSKLLIEASDKALYKGKDLGRRSAS